MLPTTNDSLACTVVLVVGTVGPTVVARKSTQSTRSKLRTLGLTLSPWYGLPVFLRLLLDLPADCSARPFRLYPPSALRRSALPKPTHPPPHCRQLTVASCYTRFDQLQDAHGRHARLSSAPDMRVITPPNHPMPSLTYTPRVMRSPSKLESSTRRSPLMTCSLSCMKCQSRIRSSFRFQLGKCRAVP